MTLLEIILIAIALAMDAITVSLSYSIGCPGFPRRSFLIMAAFFGAFQAGMPLIGWFLGSNFRRFIEACDHWIVFILLAIIGLKMIYSGLFESPESEKTVCSISFKTLTFLAIATRLDALAVGVGFALLEINIIEAAAIIGIITFSLCIPAGFLGRKLGLVFGKRMECLGGVILILVGVRILIDHTCV